MFNGVLRVFVEAEPGTEQKASSFSAFDERASLGEALLCKPLVSCIRL